MGKTIYGAQVNFRDFTAHVRSFHSMLSIRQTAALLQTCPDKAPRWRNNGDSHSRGNAICKTEDNFRESRVVIHDPVLHLSSPVKLSDHVILSPETRSV